MNTIDDAITFFLQSLSHRGFSTETISTRKDALKSLNTFLKNKKCFYVTAITEAQLIEYASFVHRSRAKVSKSAWTTKEGKLLSTARKRTLIISLKLFFKWLLQNQLILNNPALDITAPAPDKHLPRDVFTLDEINKITRQIDLTTRYGLRDRAIIETIYSTGIRRKEVALLKVADLEPRRGTLFVREGKGRKPRVVPIGKRAIKWLEIYLEHGRPRLLKNRADEGFMFVSRRNSQICREYIGMLIKAYREKAEVTTKGACHSLRHSMATHMLKNGADVRYIQEILGHSRISTTEIYTSVNISDLKAVYEKTHPSANWNVRD